MSLASETLEAILETLLGPDLIQKSQALDHLTLEVYAGSILRVLSIVKDNSHCQFKQLTDICAVDYPARPQRFEVVYHLLSLVYNQRLRIKLTTDGVIPVPSVIDIYACANWYEREAWDLLGIPFSNHPDLRRLLTDYNFEGHPLRKDFPLTGFHEVRYDDKAKRVVYEAVSLPQNYRIFDFESPWEGVRESVKHSPETTTESKQPVITPSPPGAVSP